MNYTHKVVDNLSSILHFYDETSDTLYSEGGESHGKGWVIFFKNSDRYKLEELNFTLENE